MFCLLGDSPASVFSVTGRRLLSKSLTRKKSGPIGRVRNGEGACPSTRIGFGGQQFSVEACSNTRI
jgi:hypothetical protein